jgi:hypothetical protein
MCSVHLSEEPSNIEQIQRIDNRKIRDIVPETAPKTTYVT